MSTNIAAKRNDDALSPVSSADMPRVLRDQQEFKKQLDARMAHVMGARPRGRYNNLNSRTPVAKLQMAIPASIVMPANMFSVDQAHNPTLPHHGNHASMKFLDAPELKTLGAQTSFRDPISKKDVNYSAPGQTLAVGANAAATLIPNPKDMNDLTPNQAPTPGQPKKPAALAHLGGGKPQARHQAASSPRMSMGGLVKRARKWGIGSFDYAAAF